MTARCGAVRARDDERAGPPSGVVYPAPERGATAWTGVAAAMFAVAWGGNAFTPLLGLYWDTFGFGELAVNTLLSAYVVGIIPALFAAGHLVVRFGPKRVLITAPVLSMLGSLLLAAGHWVHPLLYAGRAAIGLALGLGMVVGGVWLTALSSPPWHPVARTGLGARRAAMSLTAGFGLGAGAMGAVAQWSPLPTVLPYSMHLVLSVIALLMVARSPDVEPPPPASGRAAPPDTGAVHLRVLPVAPWVFGSLGLAYAILPQLVQDRIGSLITVYSAVLCLISLGGGFITQRLLARLRDPAGVPSALIGFALFVTTVCVAAGLMGMLSPWLVLVLAGVLGSSYGFMIAGCLQEIEYGVPPERLARSVSLVWALSYAGFALPTAVSLLHRATGLGHARILLGTAAAATLTVAATRLLARRTSRAAAAPVATARSEAVPVRPE